MIRIVLGNGSGPRLPQMRAKRKARVAGLTLFSFGALRERMLLDSGLFLMRGAGQDVMPYCFIFLMSVE